MVVKDKNVKVVQVGNRYHVEVNADGFYYCKAGFTTKEEAEKEAEKHRKRFVSFIGGYEGRS